MNTDKTNSMRLKLKQMFDEQFWLLCLLAPLVLIATLIGLNLQSSQKSIVDVKVNSGLGLSAEVSSAELALIVVKPLSELLAMDVYFDQQSKTRHSTQGTSLNIAANLNHKDYNQSLMNNTVKQRLARKIIKAAADG